MGLDFALDYTNLQTFALEDIHDWTDKGLMPSAILLNPLSIWLTVTGFSCGDQSDLSCCVPWSDLQSFDNIRNGSTQVLNYGDPQDQGYPVADSGSGNLIAENFVDQIVPGKDFPESEFSQKLWKFINICSGWFSDFVQALLQCPDDFCLPVLEKYS